nr:pleiotropic drug resistance protein 1-like [Tanacetum cinerariifolium]
ERDANIEPDPDLDICMKVAATESQEDYVISDYTVKYQPPSGQYQYVVMIIRFCAFFHFKSEEEIYKIEAMAMKKPKVTTFEEQNKIIYPALKKEKAPPASEPTKSGGGIYRSRFLNEYGEGSKYKIEEVIGKGSYGVVRENLLFVSATAIHRRIGK